MNVLEVEKNFAALVNKVHVEGITIDLERDNRVIARLTPAASPTSVTVAGLATFLQGLPSLGDDAVEFQNDIRAMRSAFPMDANSWD